jgi:hypothetical protein
MKRLDHSKEHGHGNHISPRSPDRYAPTVRKLPADSVPLGSSISINGKHVYGAYDSSEQLIAVAATADEARRMGRDKIRRKESEAIKARAVPGHAVAEGNGQKS